MLVHFMTMGSELLVIFYKKTRVRSSEEINKQINRGMDNNFVKFYNFG